MTSRRESDLSGEVANSTWQLREAKAKLSELVRRARTEGPQTIAVPGERAVVVLDEDTYRKLDPANAPEKRVSNPDSPWFGMTLTEVLLNAPRLDLPDDEFDALFARNRDDFGRIIVFSDE